MNNFISNNIIKLFRYNNKINVMFINITLLVLLASVALYYIDIFDFHNNQNVIYHKLTTELVKVGYNIIYLYSACQIKMNKIITYVSLPYSHLINYFKQFLQDDKIIRLRVFCKISNTDGTIIDKLYFDETSDINDVKLIHDHVHQTKDKELIEDVSFIFPEPDKASSTCINKVFFNSFPNSLEYTVSDVKFMSIELDYNNDVYQICLKNDYYNYYIVNNCLNQNFIKYYLKNELKINEKIEGNIEYNLTIIDHNVNIVSINHDQYIVFTKDNYEIQTNKTKGN
jgi:hypothetical protein